MSPELSEAFRRLESWSQTLANHCKSDLQEVKKTLEGLKPVGPAPSKESLALMELKAIEQDVREITAALAEIKAGI